MAYAAVSDLLYTVFSLGGWIIRMKIEHSNIFRPTQFFVIPEFLNVSILKCLDLPEFLNVSILKCLDLLTCSKTGIFRCFHIKMSGFNNLFKNRNF